jgi:DNA processing protein
MIDIKKIIMQKSSLESWLSLALTERVGVMTMLKLISYLGSVDAVLAQNLTTLERYTNKTVAKLIYEKSSKELVEKSLKWVNAKNNRYIITIEDILYPAELKEISDPPLVLYLEGNISLLQNRKIAIVGTRHPTKQGAENAVNFARDLANNGLTVVSGMALGIDKYVHYGALQSKYSTIGVIGTGLDIRYPKSNNELYSKVLEHGLLISEFALGIAPLAGNFPRRNRIVAGLSLGCLVIESSIDGGSMITANFAADMGREVMAIPGSIYNPVAKGCHKLIKSGAKLVENANDILEELNFFSHKINDLVSDEVDDPLLDAMGYEPINIDAICINANMEFSDICARLLDFELNGLITNCGNGYYQRIFKHIG